MLNETVLSTLTAWALAIYPWTLTYLLHSTLLLGLAWLITRRLSIDASGIKDGVWKIAIVGGIVTSAAQCLIGLDPVAGRVTIGTPSAAPALERPATMPRPVTPRGDTETLLVSFPRPGVTRASDTRAIPARSTASPTAATPMTAPASSSDWTKAVRDDWPGMLLGIWIGVTTLLLVRLGVRRLAIRHLLRDREPLTDGPLSEQLEAMCRRCDVPFRVRLTLSDRLTSPIAFGTREICVPRRALRELNDDQRATMLAHELAHLLRRDPSWLLACAFVETLFFFQPLNRMARRSMTETAEYLCDDEAVRLTGGNVSLAKCLATVATWVRPENTYPYAATMLDRPSPLIRRVQRLLDDHRPAFRPGRGLTVGAGALASLLALYVAPGVRAGSEVPASMDSAEVNWESPARTEPTGPDDGIIVYAEGAEPLSASPVSDTSASTSQESPSEQRASEERKDDGGIVVSDEEMTIDERGDEWIVRLSGRRVPRELVAVENGKVVVFGDNGLVTHRIPLDVAREMARKSRSVAVGSLPEVTAQLEALREQFANLSDDLSEDELDALRDELETQYEEALEAYDEDLGPGLDRETKRDLRLASRAYSQAARELARAHQRWNLGLGYDEDSDYDYSDNFNYNYDDESDPDWDWDWDWDWNSSGHGGWDIDPDWANNETVRSLLRGDSVTKQELDAAGVDLNEPLAHGRTLLEIAIREGEFLLAEELIRLGADTGVLDSNDRSLLHVAADEGDVDMVALWLKASVPVDARDRRDRTPLHLAAAQGEPDVIAQLAAAGADLNAADSRGLTPLHVAAGEDEWAAVDALLRAGASVDVRDTRDRTPLHVAAMEGDADIVLSLLDAGADAEATDGRGRTPLELADRSDESEVAIILRKHTDHR